MNLRPMEVRDNPAVAQLIRASLEEFGLTNQNCLL